MSFTFTVTGTWEASTEQVCANVWPHDITPEEVATRIRDEYGSLLGWMNEWNLDGIAEVEVNGVSIFKATV